MSTLDRWAWANGPLAVIDAIATDVCLWICDITAPKTAVTEKLNTETKTENKDTDIVILEKYKTDQEKAKSVLNFSVSEQPEVKESSMTDDELEELLESVSSKVIMSSGIEVAEEQKVINLAQLALLAAINKCTVVQVASNGHLPSQDDIVTVNTIFKWFTGTKLFPSQGAVQLNEVITSQLLYDIVTEMYNTKDNWQQDEVFSNIVEKVRKRLELENASQGKLNQDEGSEDAVVPVFFNQRILDNPFGEIPKGTVKKTETEYIRKFLEGLLPEDLKVSIQYFMDPYDPRSLRDTGCVEAVITSNDYPINKLLVDLDNIAANGYSVRIPTWYADRNSVDGMWISMEKFPEVIKNYILNPNWILGNPNDPDSILMFNEVIKDRNYQPEMYLYYDFSGMSKHFSFMTPEDKDTFGKNLSLITQANWSTMGPGEGFYRMRIRNYKNPNSFTLVSDSKTRVQLPGMVPAVGGNYKKYVQDPIEDLVDKEILVCKFKDGKLDVSRNGVKIDIEIP